MPATRDRTVSARLTALHALLRVMQQGQSLSTVRPWVYEKLPPRERGLAMELVHGVLRWRWRLEALLLACLDKPLRQREAEVRILLCMALYEIENLQSPDYAVVDETVKAVRKLRKAWAAALVNAVLRRFLRERETLVQGLDASQRASHPPWLLQALQADWPQHWQQIVEANNRRAPLHLRINRMRGTRQNYLDILRQQDIDARAHDWMPSAVVLPQALEVTQLPGYAQGDFAVQDAGAQLAAQLLDASPGQRVLDMCAAPGGKTCHLLERADNRLDLLALDKDAERLARVEENLQRLQLTARTRVADAASDDWHEEALQGGAFDRVLLDAPCSASGIIRRHPDIKSLRQAEDIAALTALQQRMLHSAWQVLKPGGRLLYATCSVLRAENSEQVAAFVAATGDAEAVVLDDAPGVACEVGRQLLPGIADSDGFYYALLQKRK